MLIVRTKYTSKASLLV